MSLDEKERDELGAAREALAKLRAKHIKKPFYRNTYNGDGTLISYAVAGYHCITCSKTHFLGHCEGCEDDLDYCDGVYTTSSSGTWPCPTIALIGEES